MVLAALAALVCTAGNLLAQGVTVTGRVLLGGQSSHPVPSQWVVLHEVRRDSGGPVDSARTDARGAYRVRVPSVDTTAMYLVSTMYKAVGYFSSPLRLEGAGGRAEAEPLLVHDTTSVGPPMKVTRRLIVLFRPSEAGRNVIELVELQNPGNRTRIANDSLHPVWTLALSPDATGWEVGEGDFSPESMVLEGDTIKLYAPVWPGAPRQASYQYFVSGSELEIPIDQPIEELDLLVEDTSAVLSGISLDSLGTDKYEQEGRYFAAYRAGPLAPGAAVRVKFSGAPLSPEQLVPYIAALAGLALAWGLYVALKKKPARKPSAISPQPSGKSKGKQQQAAKQH